MIGMASLLLKSVSLVIQIVVSGKRKYLRRKVTDCLLFKKPLIRLNENLAGLAGIWGIGLDTQGRA
ncbi:MAG: hypothetical protein NWR54_03305, partial [Paracoccaceae bacterium]|nr:hypothetical protein [Paracoccaceae bacterium]